MPTLSFMQATLSICIFINGFWICYYAVAGTRYMESYEVYEIPLNESRQLQENATSDPGPSPLAKLAQATPNQKNQVPVSQGVWWAFDIVFFLETALNLVSDVVMEVNLCSQGPYCFEVRMFEVDLNTFNEEWGACFVPHGVENYMRGDTSGADKKLEYFLPWKCFSTGLCYLVSLVLAYFKGKAESLEKEIQPTARALFSGTSLVIMDAVVYTVVAAVKVGVIFGMYRFYRNFTTPMNPSNQPLAQPAGQGTRGSISQQGYPVAAGGGAPASNPPYPEARSGRATGSRGSTSGRSSISPYPGASAGTATGSRASKSGRSSISPNPGARSGTATGSRGSTSGRSSISLYSGAGAGRATGSRGSTSGRSSTSARGVINV